MNRREAMHSLGLASTHVLFPSILLGFISSCTNPEKTREGFGPIFFNKEEFDLVREIIDIVLPSTNSKSASEVNTHHFLDEVFAKCMTKEQQLQIKEGLSKLMHAFSSSQDKLSLLMAIDKKAYGNDSEAAYFRTIKQYAMVGFFTSQEGMTKASNYIQFPGDYKGTIPCDENTLSYGKTNLRYYL